jgi:hypothetical protein
MLILQKCKNLCGGDGGGGGVHRLHIAMYQETLKKGNTQQSKPLHPDKL